jgi:alpha-1,2-mannosyltransferase
MLAYASWLRNNVKTAIFSIGFAVLVGWPFVVILGLPICIDVCFVKGSNIFSSILYFLKWTIAFGLLISIPMILVDSYFFGKFVFAPLNIVMYNVFPQNPNQGPDIYGKEPLSFYIKNGFLNFNLLFPMAFASVLFLVWEFFKLKNTSNLKSLRINVCYNFVVLGMLLWSLVFFTRPHKEERFLYPIYPLILISASYTLNYVHLKVKKVFSMLRMTLVWEILPSFIIILHALFSISRGVALIKNYSASIEIYTVLNQPSIKFSTPWLENKEEINVCVSKEWYRFPSSFFIPEKLDLVSKHQYWKLAFLESDFKGQLPGYFNRSLSLPMSTRYVDKLFNDENKEVIQRYHNIKKCDFFIDTDSAEDDTSQNLLLNKVNTKTNWKTLSKIKFLDSDNPSMFRSFYVPFLSEKKLKFTFFKLRVQIK